MKFDIYDIITTDFLTNVFLTGVRLTDDAGTAYPDSLFESSIKYAVDIIEKELEINFNPYRVKRERHDAWSDHRRKWWGLELDERPVKSVDKMDITYGNYDPASLPLSWITELEPNTGAIALVPSGEQLGTFSFSNAIPLLVDPISNYSYYRHVPGYFSVDYTTGFNFVEGQITIPVNTDEVLDITINEKLVGKAQFIFEIVDDGNGNIAGAAVPKVKAFDVGDDKFSATILTTPTVSDAIIKYKLHTVPQGLIQAIGFVAAALPLDTAGDLIAGAGIGSFSIGVDGLSQSVATTSSATNAGYGAKLISYRNQVKQILKTYRSDYNKAMLGAH